MAAADDFDQVVEQYHSALGEFAKGNPEPVKNNIYSHREDAAIANPFFPLTRGWEQVAERLERSALNFRDGEVSYENVVKYVTPALAYIVEIEQWKAKVGGREEITPFTLRVTSILRPEDGVWKVVHRHADPITTPQPAESVLQE